MKYTFTFLAILAGLLSHAQTDAGGHPVLHSISMGEDTIGDCRLLANYYPLHNNVDDRTTSVYISDTPGIREMEKAATNLPADFFVLVRDNQIIKLILVNNYPDKYILVSTPGEDKPKFYQKRVKGDIAENRAIELVRSRLDSSATIVDGKLLFNGRHYSIMSNQDIKAAVIGLIKKEHFDSAQPSGTRLLTKAEIHERVLQETKEGGKLDFFTQIKGHEMDGIQVKPGLLDTRIDMALYSWGRACYEAGVADVDEAHAIFTEFKGRPLNIREREYIKLGFEKGLEK